MKDSLCVCIGYPDMQAARYVDRLKAIDPRIETVALPVEPDADWVRVSPADPHPEPPPWAEAHADERRAALSRAQVLVALHTPADLVKLAPGLQWVQCIGAGVDQFASAGITQESVVVTNGSGLSSASMAEFVIARLLQIWKRLPEIDSYQRERRYVQTYGRTFRGSTIAIVGLGHIGRAVALRARALGCRVLGLRRSAPSEEDRACTDECFPLEALHAMLAQCDAAVVCAPETPDTRGLIDAAALDAMPRGATLVNVARGSLVDEAALVAALESGALGAAALDVFAQEPLPETSPLWTIPNLYASAHSSVSTDRYIDDAFELFEANLGRYVRGEPLRNVVDKAQLGFPAR